jgi:formylmethanofuran dehydrogenase subunit B
LAKTVALPSPPPFRGRESTRRVVWLCPPHKNDWLRRLPDLAAIGRDAAELPTLLALLRARLHGHPVAITGRALAAVDATVATLKAARFGVAIWSAADLDALSIEMLCTLVDDLNAETRFTGVPLPPPDNGRGVLEACGWMTGLPMRTGFGRGWPEHDPWRFDAARLVDSGECDCALWISACRHAVPDWRRDVPIVALATPATSFRSAPHVLIEVGAPGIDHDAVMANPLSATLMPMTATRPSDAVPVAAVIADLLAALPEAPPC